MKRELKIGDSQIISIENGIVSVPDSVRMSIAEIADLFGIYYQTTKKNIRAIEKSGVVAGDYSTGCTVDGQKIYPEYYSLDMVTAVAFRIRSHKAEIFRDWLLRRMATADKVNVVWKIPLFGAMLN